MTDEWDGAFLATLANMPSGPFSTYDYIQRFQAEHPAAWQELEQSHGAGGKGAGQYRTVNTQVAHTLSRLARAGVLKSLGYRDSAPDIWGNKSIAYWNVGEDSAEKEADLILDQEYREGSLILKAHLQRERHWGLARKKKESFVKEHGHLFCERCDLDPGKAFGLPIGNAVMEVHHAAVAVGEMGKNHVTKLSDLQCLCANCHRLVHTKMNSSLP